MLYLIFEFNQQLYAIDTNEIVEIIPYVNFTEGRATGVPTILKSMKNNGSPAPLFETDDERSYFKTTLKIHREFLKHEKPFEKVDPASTPQAPLKYHSSTTQVKSLLLIFKGEMSREELMTAMKLKNRAYFRANIIKPALELGLIEMTIPGKPNSPKQKYRITKRGRKYLETVKLNNNN